MQNKFVTPARDAEGNAKRIPDPVTGVALPDGGAWKPCSQYWLRRIAAGDVTEGEPTIETPPANPVEVEVAPATSVAATK